MVTQWQPILSVILELLNKLLSAKMFWLTFEILGVNQTLNIDAWTHHKDATSSSTCSRPMQAPDLKAKTDKKGN